MSWTAENEHKETNDEEKEREAVMIRDKIDKLMTQTFKDEWAQEYPALHRDEAWIRSRPNPWHDTFDDSLYRAMQASGFTSDSNASRVVPSSASPQPEPLSLLPPRASTSRQTSTSIFAAASSSSSSAVSSSSSEDVDTSDPESSDETVKYDDNHNKKPSNFPHKKNKKKKKRKGKKRWPDSQGSTRFGRQQDFIFADASDQDAADRFLASTSASEHPPKPKWSIVKADYDPLPSYDFVTPILECRPGESVEFDHHPLVTWEPHRRWETYETSELKEFWEAALATLEVTVEDMTFRSRDPFIDKSQFRTVQNWLQERSHMEPDLVQELSAVNQIPNDGILAVWLLNRHEVGEDVRPAWTRVLLKSVKELSDFFKRPLVEVLDDYRNSWREHERRPRVSQRPMQSAFRTLCPVHLHYQCPDHFDPFHDAENGTKATSLTRDKAIPPEVKESAIKSCDSGICWYELKGDDVDVDHVQKLRKMSFAELTESWSQEDRAFFREIFPKFHNVTPCQMALFMPGHNCRDFYFIIQRAKAEGYDNPPRGSDPHECKEAATASKTQSKTIDQAVVESENITQTLHVLQHRHEDAKQAQLNKEASSKQREEEMEEKHWKQLKPNETWGYTPCMHPGRTCAEAGEDCMCTDNRVWCDKFCHCALDCPRRFPGCYNECHRKGNRCRTDECPCYRMCRECDPEICNGPVKYPQVCGNMQMQTRAHKKNFVGISPVEGFGLFAGEVCRDGDLVEEYKGELISQEEANARDLVFKRRHKTYFYELDRRKGIDSEFFGNRARYINAPPSGEGTQKKQKPNCQARVVYTLGEHRIGVFCDKPRILPGEELLMDYGPLYEFYTPA